MEVNIIRIKSGLHWSDRHSILNQVDPTKVNVVVNAAVDLTAFKNHVEAMVDTFKFGQCTRVEGMFSSINPELRSFLLDAGISFVDTANGKSFLYAVDRMLNTGYRISTIVLCSKVCAFIKEKNAPDVKVVAKFLESFTSLNLNVCITGHSSRVEKIQYGSRPIHMTPPDVVITYSFEVSGGEYLSSVEEFYIEVRWQGNSMYVENNFLQPFKRAETA